MPTNLRKEGCPSPGACELQLSSGRESGLFPGPHRAVFSFTLPGLFLHEAKKNPSFFSHLFLSPSLCFQILKLALSPYLAVLFILRASVGLYMHFCIEDHSI